MKNAHTRMPAEKFCVAASTFFGTVTSSWAQHGTQSEFVDVSREHFHRGITARVG